MNNPINKIRGFATQASRWTRSAVVDGYGVGKEVVTSGRAMRRIGTRAAIGAGIGAGVGAGYSYGTNDYQMRRDMGAGIAAGAALGAGWGAFGPTRSVWKAQRTPIPTPSMASRARAGFGNYMREGFSRVFPG